MSLALCAGSETPSSVHTLVLTAQVLFSHLGRNGDPQSIVKCFSALSSIISPDQLSFPARTIFFLTSLSGLLSPVFCPFEVSYPWHFPPRPFCWFRPWPSSEHCQHHQLGASAPRLPNSVQLPLCWTPCVIAGLQLPHVTAPVVSVKDRVASLNRPGIYASSWIFIQHIANPQ